ncbi:MAG: heme-binding protein [Halioglobus sp.]
MAIEEAEYRVVLEEDPFELRYYEPHMVAETLGEGDFEDAGGDAFGRLFKYISGENRSRQKIEMTAPVGQTALSQKIDMTAPVEQTQVDGRWVVSFMMPSAYTAESAPEPIDPRVTLRQVPARKMAAVTYSGLWSESGYLTNKTNLEAWIAKKGFSIVGEPVWARYNSPFTLWFLRRNEVLIPVEDAHLSE